MASTTFSDGTTVIQASWLNAVNDFYYDVFNGAETVAQARSAISAMASIGDTVTGNYTINGDVTLTGALDFGSITIDADEVTYDNTASGFTATDVQAAIDEIVASAGVLSFEGRTGAVTGQSGDYDADQITYDNSTSGLTATDVKAAIDEVVSEKADIASNENITGTWTFYSTGTGSQPVPQSDAAELFLLTESAGIGVQGYCGTLWFGSGEGGGTDRKKKSSGIAAYAPEDFTASSSPSRLEFWTTPSGSTTPLKRMDIEEDGVVKIGSNVVFHAGNPNLTPFLRDDATSTKTSGNLILNDNINMRLGTGEDFRIYHNGSNNFFDVYGGDLFIRNTTITKFTFDISAGDLTATGDVNAVDFNATSDLTLKENLQEITDSLNKVTQINGYTFNFIGEEDRRAGLIAQEVQQVLPEAVSEREDGILTISYGQVIALLVESVKELKQEIEELKGNGSSV